jgi:enamine deaminase RidA (YjgF/YER057c/UK114 family)
MELSAGQHAARICGINLIAQCKAAVGELSNIRRVVKLGGFVNAAPGFVDIPQVINGCSDLMVEVFGEAGKHARAAVACPTLPLGVAVEVDGVFEIA